MARLRDIPGAASRALQFTILTVLRSVMQGVLQNAMRPPQPAYRAYPPTPYGGAPASAASDPSMVAELQRMLDDLGYDAGPADGAGAQTAQALSSFERDHGQPPSAELSGPAGKNRR